VKVKICGLTRSEDVQAAVDAGADALGFVFTRSPRQLAPDTAKDLCDMVPDGILRVGLFLNQTGAQVDSIIHSVALDLLQFHGAETDEFCASFGLPYLKAVAVSDVNSAARAQTAYPGANGLLFDSHIVGTRGGRGMVFDWTLLQSRQLSKPVWLAGGLNIGNVGQAIEIVRPYAVDVSSGVEVSPGVKDAAMIRAFIQAAKNSS